VNPWFAVPLLAGLACLVLGVLIVAREPEATSHRCTGALLFGAAWWGMCEALWTLAPDPERAMLWLRISAPGWACVGPVAMHLFLSQTRRAPRALWAALPFAYAAAATAVVLVWTTNWIDASMVRVAWGYAYRAGPAYGAWYTFTVLTSSSGILALLRELRGGASPAEAHQSPWLGVGVCVPMFVGSVTDGLLPWMGIDVPRLGPPSFAVMGLVIALSIRRFGYALMSAGSFASEILGAMPEGVALLTPDGRIRVANPGLAALLGLPAGADLRERAVASFLPRVPFDCEPPLRQHEAELVNAQGEKSPVVVSTEPLRDRRNGLLGFVLVVRDQREVVQLRARLLTSARLAAVGELAAGIAHEINNPLAYIGTNLRALRQDWLSLEAAWRAGAKSERLDEVFDQGVAMLDESLEGVERTAAIVRDVRAFSHGGGGEPESVDPNELVERALRVAAPHLRKRARVVRELAPVPHVNGVRRELEQVLLNLVINAAQAVEHSGTVVARTASRGGEVLISVIDDGPGIRPDVIERIFDPFFTTKPVGEGTGLGLSISHEIVRRHGGRIEVSSRAGRGTEFRVALPAAEE
jgi:signal transduction histidine kinase